MQHDSRRRRIALRIRHCLPWCYCAAASFIVSVSFQCGSVEADETEENHRYNSYVPIVPPIAWDEIRLRSKNCPEVGYLIECLPATADDPARLGIAVCAKDWSNKRYTTQTILSIDSSGSAFWGCGPAGILCGKRHFECIELSPRQAERFKQLVANFSSNIGCPVSEEDRRFAPSSLLSISTPYTTLGNPPVRDRFRDTTLLFGFGCVLTAFRVDEEVTAKHEDYYHGRLSPFAPASIKSTFGEAHRKRREQVEGLIRSVERLLKDVKLEAEGAEPRERKAPCPGASAQTATTDAKVCCQENSMKRSRSYRLRRVRFRVLRRR